MTRLSISPWCGLGNGSGKARIVACRRQSCWARVLYRRRLNTTVRIDLEAVVIGEVAEAGNASRAMLVIKLVVAGRGPVEKFESAISQIERLLKVRILAYLVLQISEDRDGVRLHALNLIRSGLLGLPERGAGVGGLGVDAGFTPRLTGSAPSRLAGRRCRQPPQARASGARRIVVRP